MSFMSVQTVRRTDSERVSCLIAAKRDGKVRVDHRSGGAILFRRRLGVDLQRQGRIGVSEAHLRSLTSMFFDFGRFTASVSSQ